MTIPQRLKRAPLRRAASMIAVACALLATPASAAEDESAAVLAANARFYAALNKLFTGDAAAIEAVWSHAGDVTYMGPGGGFERGWSAAFEVWKSQAALKLGGRVEPVDVHMAIGPEIAVVTNYEEGENTNANGKAERVKLRATNTYRKEGGEWKMIGHHTDPLPFLAK